MRKKMVVMLLSVVLLTGCSSTGTSGSGSEVSSSTESTKTEEKTQTAEESSNLDAIGSVEVEKNLFTVELTIPADYIGEVTQQDLDASVSEKGFKSATLNADGSVTYVMTKEQHKEMLDGIKQEIDNVLNEMCGSENYPNFTQISANDDYTKFTVTTKSTELDMTESFSVMAFYMYGGMYGVFSGENVDNVHVDFVNADSGDVISSSDSKNMGN